MGVWDNQQDGPPCCGCFGQVVSPRASSRPSSASATANTDTPQPVKVKEPERPGGWTITAEVVAGAQPASLPAVNNSHRLDSLPPGADELHEVGDKQVC